MGNLIIDLKKSQLVKKKVLAQRKDGTTYMTTVHVNPNKNKPKKRSRKQKENLEFDINKFDKLAHTDKTKALEYAKKAGITWEENKHAGINWMRAKMAIKEASSSTSPTPKTTPKTVDKRQEKINNLLKQKDTTGKEIAKTLGMVGADTQSSEYLEEFLFPRFKSQAEKIDRKEAGKIVDVSLFEGAVNKQIVRAVQKIVTLPLRNLRHKNSTKKIFGGWIDPRAELSGELRSFKGSTYYDTAVLTAKTEDAYGDSMLDKVVEKLENHPDYAGEMDKWKGNYETLKEISGGNKDIMSVIQGVARNEWSLDKKMMTLKHDLNVIKRDADKVLENNKKIESILKNTVGVEDPQSYVEDLVSTTTKEVRASKSPGRMIDDTVYESGGVKMVLKQAPYHKPGSGYTLTIHQSPEVLVWNVESSLKDNKNAQKASDLIDNLNPVDMKKALKAGSRLYFDSNEDILRNLHYYNKAAEIVVKSGWEVKHDIIKNIEPISHKEIEILNSHDPEKVATLMEDLALRIGKFKPSLEKKLGSLDKVRSNLESTLEQNREEMESHKLTPETLLSEGDIKCTVETVKGKELERIKDQINDDWDYRTHGSMNYKIKGVYRVSDLPAEVEFNKLKEHRGGSAELYHGTGSFATTLILGKSGQFKVVEAKVGRMLGDGIYMADKSSKSAQYISDTGMTRRGAQGTLMLCESALGKTVNDPGNKNGDTVEARSNTHEWRHLRNNEWCVRDPLAVLPKYLIHIQL